MPVNQLQGAISRAFDAALAGHPKRAREARHRAAFDRAWRKLGYSATDPRKARVFAQALPLLKAGDARDDLRAALVAADARQARTRRLMAARALGRRQGRELALREHHQALTAALDARIEAIQARRARLRPPGPIRIW